MYMSNVKISLPYEIIKIVAEKVVNWDIKVSLSNHLENGEKGWRSGKSARLPPMCVPGSIPTQCHMLVLVLAPRVFLRFSGFPPSTKTNTPNSNSTRIEDPHENQRRLMWLPL